FSIGSSGSRFALNRSESRRDGGFKHSWSFSIVLTCPESPGRVLLRCFTLPWKQASSRESTLAGRTS
uniref:Uncharacterized protein n=1 Tax=Poecilia mexicana TaxID=48701 RepID=A0A3B3Y259_9TELE